ncbi:MAG: SDR family oxidoreductase [Bacteroidetes bacterium]|nr:SDR family oxidoreductase [Bacteroidota bacterium]
MALDERIAFVTGSGRRLGRQIAYAFADAGYDIILHAHSSVDGMKEAAAVIRARGRQVHLLEGDLRSVDDIRRMAEGVADICDGLDVLINNAGVFPRAAFEDVTEDIWDLAQDVNLKGPFFLTQSLAPLLRKRHGSVVNIASAGGFDPWKQHIPYNVSKAGMIMLTRAMAKALAPEVRVNAVAPGVIIVPGEEVLDHIPAERFPMQRYGTPQDLADAVLFLAQGNRYITGHVLPLAGGSITI